MMLREMSTTIAPTEAAAFDSIVRHEYSERALQHISIFDIGKIGVDAYLRSLIDEPAPISHTEVVKSDNADTVPSQPETMPTGTVEIIIEPASEEAETAAEDKPRTTNALGRIATAPLRAASWANRMHYVGVATVIGKLPGKLTKQELLARDQARQEKYAAKEGDSLLTRSRKLLGRNALRAAAWMPTIAMGVLGTSSMWRPLLPELMMHDVSSPWTEGAVSKPLTAADAPVAAMLPPAPLPEPYVAPQPSFVDLPDVKHKIDWQPPQKPVVSTPHPTPLEKPAPAPRSGDVVIPVGGATDPNGDMVAATLDPNKARIIRMNYPAEMGPFVGTTPTNVSQAEGVQNIIDLVKQHPGAKITLKGFSEGSFVTNEAARQLADMGIHVNVVNAGDGNGAAGILNHPLAEMVQPMLNSFGIPKTPPVAGSTELLSGRDAWASTAGDDPGRLLDKFTKIPVDHRIPGDNEIPIQMFTKDGVTYKVFDEPVALPVGAVDITPGGSPVPLPPPPIDQPPIPAPIGQPVLPDQAPVDIPAPVIPFPTPPVPDQELAPAA